MKPSVRCARCGGALPSMSAPTVTPADVQSMLKPLLKPDPAPSLSAALRAAAARPTDLRALFRRPVPVTR